MMPAHATVRPDERVLHAAATVFEQIAPRLTGQEFKILLDLLLSAPTRVREVELLRPPPREGESKLSRW